MAKKSTSKSASGGKTSAGVGGETHQTSSAPADALTSNFGVAVSDNQNSLKAGVRGPSLLEDFVLREKIHHFDHERIPERIVHARGSGAHGVFELSKSLKKHTLAKILTEVGEKTEVFVRFSTVAGGAGSADTPRDVRGFAVKFYTKEGNWDLVGNNIPVFFIQDAIKFPDLIHSVKMEADKGYPQAASAHDTFWDFISLMPESTHMIMWAMSDRALPRSLRMIEGFGVHTFRLLNDAGEAVFVKFHWRPVLGLQSTAWDEAVKIAGADSDYHRRDLFESIEAGDFPAWDLGVQILDEAEADKLPFDVLDATKLIPEEMHSVEIVGRMTLNRNPDNFFAETEQVAFLPSNMPPGIDVSEDPLLQGRLFSYLDTQLSRLGTPNWHQIPVNSSKGCPFLNMQRDGQMQGKVFTGRANYEPNSLAAAGENGGPRETPSGYHTAPAPMMGTKLRQRSETFSDHYSQARLFYRSQSPVEQGHIRAAIVFELSKVTLAHVRERVLSNLQNVDSGLADRVAQGLGMDKAPAPSTPAAAPIEMKASPALRLIGKYPASLKGRCVGILVGDGADAKAVASARDAVKKAGARAKIVTAKISGAKLSDGSMLEGDGIVDGTPSVLYDAVLLMLSEASAKEMSLNSAAVAFVGDAFNHLKAIGHTDGAAALMKKAGIEADEFVVDLKSGAGPFIAAAGNRNWGREPKVRIIP